MTLKHLVPPDVPENKWRAASEIDSRLVIAWNSAMSDQALSLGLDFSRHGWPYGPNISPQQREQVILWCLERGYAPAGWKCLGILARGVSRGRRPACPVSTDGSCQCFTGGAWRMFESTGPVDHVSTWNWKTGPGERSEPSAMLLQPYGSPKKFSEWCETLVGYFEESDLPLQVEAYPKGEYGQGRYSDGRPMSQAAWYADGSIIITRKRA